MDKMPNGGKVVIVDDCIEEILPLINILNKKTVPILYYSGNLEDLPEEPLQGIRVFFLDLRFSTNTDEKTIVSNACNILSKILGDNNGPFLLIVWSSTGSEYREKLEQELIGKSYCPEYTLYLSKADYFETKESNAYSLIEEIKEILNNYDVENCDNILERISLKVISQADEQSKVFIKKNIEKLEKELYDGLSKAGLLYLFILWENTVRDSTHKVINEIYNQIPDSIPIDKKLPAMAFYLAKNRLEKQFENVDEKEKIYAAMMELTELYSYFYSENIIKMDIEDFKSLSIQKNNDFIPSEAKFNTWKMTTSPCRNEMIGNIYEDKNKIFRFFDLIREYKNEEKYIKNEDEFKSDTRIKYILANINGECETAQDKYPVIRVMPGVMIPCTVYGEYEDKKVLRSRENAKEYIFKDFEKFEYNNTNYYIIFNINQCTFLPKKSLNDLKVMFRLQRRYYLKLREQISSNFSKQGIDLYSMR